MPEPEVVRRVERVVHGEQEVRYPVFRLNFSTWVRRKSFSVLASCNQMQGLVLTAYWKNSPIFSLLSDRFAEHPIPIRHEHEWGIVRWSSARTEPPSPPPPRKARFPDDKTPSSQFMAELDEELRGMARLSEKWRRKS